MTKQQQKTFLQELMNEFRPMLQAEINALVQDALRSYVPPPQPANEGQKVKNRIDGYVPSLFWPAIFAIRDNKDDTGLLADYYARGGKAPPEWRD